MYALITKMVVAASEHERLVGLGTVSGEGQRVDTRLCFQLIYHNPYNFFLDFIYNLAERQSKR